MMSINWSLIGKASWKHIVIGITTVVAATGAGIYAFSSGSSSSKGVSSVTSLSSPSTSTTQVSQPPVGSGYLSTGPGFVVFIQWNNNYGNVSGTEEQVRETGQAPNLTTENQTSSVRGSITGSSISLHIGSSSTLFGTFSGNSMTINIPQQNGTLAPLVFHEASTVSYNNAVNSLLAGNSASNAQAAKAEQITNTENSILKDEQIVKSDIANLSYSQLISDVGSVSSDLQQEAKDLGATKTAEQKVLAEVGSASPTTVCDDAEVNVANDAEVNVANDVEASVANDVTNVVGDIQSLNSALAQIKADFPKFQAAEQTLPWFTPQGAPSQSQINQTIVNTSTAISSSISTTNGYIAQANAYVSTAFQYVAQAYQAGNCGTPPAAPSPQPPIS